MSQQPVKPFACSITECGMTFTNEDHLHVHTKKHDMVLTLGMEQKAAFVADQTPTPTRFIRNCEEVGLFQDLQNVNPFDEGFKRAMETKGGVLSLDGSLLTPAATDDVLHTPQMFYPITEAENALYNQRNITISRSSSDESGAIKEYETTTISKLTNEVTTISRVIEKSDQIYHNHHEQTNKETNLKYTNNIVTIQSNLVKKDFDSNKVVSSVASKVDQSITNCSFNEIPCKDVLLPHRSDLLPNRSDLLPNRSDLLPNRSDLLLNRSNLLPRSDVPPIISQKSLDYVVDSLTNEHYMQDHIERSDKDRNVSFVDDNIERNTKNNSTKMELRNRNVIKKPKLTPIKIKAKKPQNRKQIKDVNIKSIEQDTHDSNMSGLEVIIKLPNQKYLKMRPVEEVINSDNSNKLLTEYAKDKLKNNLQKKMGHEKKGTATQTIAQSTLQNNIILPISSGTLIPVKILNPVTTAILQPNSIDNCTVQIEHNIKTGRINNEEPQIENKHDKTKGVKRKNNSVVVLNNVDIDKVKETDVYNSNILNDKQSDNRLNDNDKVQTESELFMDSEQIDFRARKSAASQRYRRNFKLKMESQKVEYDKLKQINKRLQEENAKLKSVIIEHARKCPNPASLSVFKINPI